jgi:low temperature requirement protein LtrA
VIGRRKQSGSEYGASFLELFFDLVFVFAVTQVSHLLLDDLSWVGAGQSALVLLVVWWAWNYTTWVTNELDVESASVRLLMLGLMLAGLLMAVAIPEAFGDRSLLFAASYLAIQIGRTAFLAYAASDRGTIERARSENILIWFCVSGVLWVAGALFDGEARAIIWIAALLIDYSAPLFIYRVPGRKAVPSTAWDLGTSHFAERFGLFVIIALGESVILIGATATDLELDGPVLLSLVLSFVGTAALWWLYFSSIAARSATALAESPNAVLLARDAFTYGHVLIVAGIILVAVGDEIVIAHPEDELGRAELITVVAGPVLYLLAQAALRWRMTGGLSIRRSGAALACFVVAGIGLAGAQALVVGGLLVTILVALVVADQIVSGREEAQEQATPT